MKQRTTLADFLRSLPQGTILYSPLCGYVKVWEVNDSGIVVVLPENHGPELPDTLLFRDNGHLANHECDDDEKYQIFPTHICRTWRFLRFKENEVVTMEYKYECGQVTKFIVLYDGINVSGEWTIKVKQAAYGTYEKLYDFNTLSLQPMYTDTFTLSFRYANKEEARHFLSVLKACTDDVRAQAQVAAHLQGIKFLEQLNKS